MAEWVNQKREFYKIAIGQGLSNLGQIERAFPLGHSIPDFKIEKWLTRLLETPKAFSSQRRYVNRFMLGADPEFIFTQVMKEEVNYDARVDARHLGFQQGLAFGADNNGRLAEIRPWPSRSAVEVVASIWSTMRWMAATRADSLNYKWVTGAYLQDDGLGGHVHFGRKRPHRDAEIAALDAIALAVEKVGAFPVDELNNRRISTTHGNQPYGRYGDWRVQRHGYEYRTWPSWLDNPSLAFLVLTLSKLAVHDPTMLLEAIRARGTNWVQYIKNFLSFYKFIDDDARLASVVLSRGFPRHIGGDFKTRWGFDKPPQVAKDIKIIPPAIIPSKEEIAAVFDFLLNGKALGIPTGNPTWYPTKPPQEYGMCLSKTNTYGIKGLGEAIWDLCYEHSIPITVTCRGREQRVPILVSYDLADRIPSKYFSGGYINRGSFSGSMISLAMGELEGDRVTAIKKALVSGIFPLWRVSEIEPSSLAQWKSGCPDKVKAKCYGNVLFSSGKIPSFNQGES